MSHKYGMSIYRFLRSPTSDINAHRETPFNKEKGLGENSKCKLLTNQFESGTKMEHGDKDRAKKQLRQHEWDEVKSGSER